MDTRETKWAIEEESAGCREPHAALEVDDDGVSITEFLFGRYFPNKNKDIETSIAL